MVRFLNLTLAGLSDGMMFAAVALALVLIWRATRIVNFAQGGMLMFTTFLAWTVIEHGGSYWLALVVALLAGFVLGAVVERLIIRPVEGGPPLNAVIVTLGLLVVLQAAAGMIWGGTPHSYPPAFTIRGFTGAQIGVIKGEAIVVQGQPETTDDGSGAIQPYTTAQPQAPANGIPTQ